MISKDWKIFNDNVQIKDKEISYYEDDEGNYAVLPTANLLCGVQYNELTEEQLNIAKFEGKIPKDMKLKTIEVRPKITKDKKTGNEKDKYTIIEGDKEQRYVVWFVVDGLKNITAFNNKNDALQEAKKRNDEVLNH